MWVVYYYEDFGGKGNLSMVPLFDTLEFSMKFFSCEEYVCDLKREEESVEGSYNFYFYNGKWLMNFQVYCWCLVSF